MDDVGLGILVFGLLWTAGFAVVHFRAAGKAKAAETWPTAMGNVLSAEVVAEESSRRGEDGTTWYNPTVVYSYNVAGAALEGRRMRFGNPHCSSRKKAETALAPYAVGSTVTVRYNPGKPDEAVLETCKPKPVYLILALFGLFFVAFGLAWAQLAPWP